LHFNTIEEFQGFDFRSLSADENMQKGYKLPDFGEIVSKGENYFIMACFGDLKNYDFHYKLAFV